MTYRSFRDSYVSARGRATALVVLVIVQLALIGLAALGSLAGRFLLDGDVFGAVTIPVVDVFRLAGAAQILARLVFIAAVVLFLTWVYRSIDNLPALESTSCRFTPSRAVWGFFIPFYNLVHGYQVVATIWSDSQPPVLNEHGYSLGRNAQLVGWWWGLYLAANVLASVLPVPRGLAGLRAHATMCALQLALMFVAGLLFLFVVRESQRRQDEQWLDLERRRRVSKPTAEALR